MIISDSTTLIILFDLNREELLSNVFKKVFIPKSVYDEVSFKNSFEMPSFMEIVNVVESDLLHSLKDILDIGESEAIALAKEKNLPLIIDEKKGRKIANNLDITIIGLLGILYLNVKKNFITKSEAIDFLQISINQGYRISNKLIKDFKDSI